MKTTRLLAITLGAWLGSGTLPVAAEEARDLDGMAVIGSDELPKALYIVPWKGAELGEHEPQIGHGLEGDPLQPLDRNVFQRELHYHEAMRRPD